MTNSNSFETQDKSHLQILVLSKSEIDREELDHEEDLKDLISSKIKTDKFEEVFSKFSDDDKYYIVVVKV